MTTAAIVVGGVVLAGGSFFAGMCYIASRMFKNMF